MTETTTATTTNAAATPASSHTGRRARARSGGRTRVTARGRASATPAAASPGASSCRCSITVPAEAAPNARPRSWADENRSSGRFSRHRIDDLLERRRHGFAQVRERRRVLLEDGRDRVGGRGALERHLPGQHLVQHRPEREDVGAVIERQAAHLLGRHVWRRSEDRPGRSRLPQRGRVAASSAGAAAARTFAKPKSRIFTRPALVTNRFSGLRSRWMMPFSCAAARPRATCTP